MHPGTQNFLIIHVFLFQIDPYVTKQLSIHFENHKQGKDNSSLWDDIQSGVSMDYSFTNIQPLANIMETPGYLLHRK